MLADPSPVASSVSAGRDCRSRSREIGMSTAHALHVYLPRVVGILMKGVAVPVRGLEGRVTGLVSRSLAPRTVRCLVDEGTLAVTRHAPLLPMCSLADLGRGLLTATGTAECGRTLGATVRGRDDVSRSSGRREARRDRSWSHRSRYQSRDRSPLSDRSRSGKRSWRPGRNREEAVVASRDRCNSGSTVESAPAVAGGSIPLPMSYFPDLVRLFLSLSGPVAQRDAAVGSLLSAAGVIGAGVLPGPAAPVTSAAPVACLSVMPAPGVSTPASAASATASPGRCESARESSHPERCRRRSSVRERSRSGGKRGSGRSPCPARSARSASVSASSSSVSSLTEERVSAMPLPPS